MVAFCDATASGMRVLMLMVSSLFYFYYGGNYNVHQGGWIVGIAKRLSRAIILPKMISTIQISIILFSW